MIHVVAAVIRNDNQILLARRPDHVHQGGLWEFPGGKIETDEGREAALIRELQEELGATATHLRPLIRIPHHYHDKSVLLDVWEVSAWQGEPHGKEGQETRWVSVDMLSQFAFPAANMPIVTACRLPSQYLITPALEGDEAAFITQLEHALAGGIDLVQFRQKNLSSEAFEALAVKAIGACHQAEAKILLNADPQLATRLKADGIQLNASQLMTLAERPLSQDYLVAASCHDAHEIKKACELDLDFVVLSPVQATATHPDAPPLGWERFRELTELSTIPVYALGGVSRADMQQAWWQGGQGVSAIRALWDES